MKIQTNSFSSREPNELWKMLRDGDRNGLEGLYRYFSEDLFRYGCARGYEINFVQDSIQEVFIDLWKYHKSLQKADNVKVYLFKSLTHKMYRESKREMRFLTEDIDSVMDEVFFIESIEMQIIDAYTDENLKKKLADSLDNLPGRQKEVIHFLFFEKLTYEEVSSLMGINLSSAYTLAWKAINSLKKVVLGLGILFIS
ncbi:sigma-70 family RNA polymerase sigma factor [Algoriphagus sp. AGSA1]|uniref:RNA polymerase sigma factor n=1 Tax=Algoriphagus sp. AGSA1 TaxID=2907213 RepID=UPI001F2FAD81|nr:sigma-70 family RNA polymerase sigma factor [Algoriphagus sp. AGSA1]MCE7055244.1 sigma-70 family RNA polymerase sigma factor [Algoriphagus sp. AGSA1]